MNSFELDARNWLNSIPQKALEGIVKYHPTGSKYTCNPSVTDTDEDWVLLVKDFKHEDALGIVRIVRFNPNNFSGGLNSAGWRSSHVDSANQFGDSVSWKKKIDGVTYNLISTKDEEFYDAWVAATEEAKARNLLDKEERIDLFEDYLGPIWLKRKKEKGKKFRLEQARINARLTELVMHADPVFHF